MDQCHSAEESRLINIFMGEMFMKLKTTCTYTCPKGLKLIRKLKGVATSVHSSLWSVYIHSVGPFLYSQFRFHYLGKCRSSFLISRVCSVLYTCCALNVCG